MLITAEDGETEFGMKKLNRKIPMKKMRSKVPFANIKLAFSKDLLCFSVGMKLNVNYIRRTRRNFFYALYFKPTLPHSLLP